MAKKSTAKLHKGKKLEEQEAPEIGSRRFFNHKTRRFVHSQVNAALHSNDYDGDALDSVVSLILQDLFCDHLESKSVTTLEESSERTTGPLRNAARGSCSFHCAPWG
jgi:hypothetical protein